MKAEECIAGSSKIRGKVRERFACCGKVAVPFLLCDSTVYPFFPAAQRHRTTSGWP
jgi:hypothetical protein